MIAQRRRWKPEEIAEIRTRYQTSYIRDLADKFNVKPRQLTAIAHYYGIKKQGKPWKIGKVKRERSRLDPYALTVSRNNIGQMIMQEKDFEKAKKLEAIYKSLNEVIKKSL